MSQKRLAIRDVASTAVNVLFTTTIVASFFAPIVVFLPELLFGRSLFFGSAAQLGPLWLQLILVVALFSFMRYWIHRIQHIVPFLWELHSYHHSVTDLKASNTFVSHPIDYSAPTICRRRTASPSSRINSGIPAVSRTKATTSSCFS